MSITTVLVETPVVTVVTVPSQTTVEVVPENSTLVVDNPVVTVLTVGQQGPAGPPGTSSAVGSGGASVVYFLDETLITAGNYTLSPAPTGLAETSRSVVCNTTVNGGIEYLNRYSTLPLGGTAIEGGEWVFHTYAAASAPSGLNEIVTRINKSVVKSGITVTFTGTGATRTMVATGGTPFVSGDATSSILTATLLRTAGQTAWISSFVSSSEVVVTLTDPAYVNESGVALTHMYYLLFSVTTGDITDSVVTEFQVASIQPSFPINPTDSIVAAYFGRTDRNSNRTITLYYNGSTHYTHIETPLRIRHDDLSGLNSDGFMHLTAAEYARLSPFTPPVEMNFAYGDATPATIATAIAGKLVYGVGLHIKTPFDGVGATLRVGDAGQLDRLMTTAENAPGQVGSSTTTPAHAYGADTQILLSITPGAGATTGSGVVILHIQQ